MSDYDFYFAPEDTTNIRITELTKTLSTFLGEGYGDNEHPDFLRLAVWLDRNESAPDLTEETASEYAEKEQEQFAGDYDSQANACESIHNEYSGESDDSLANLVIDWHASWDYSYGYDFDSASYSKRQEADPADVFPMSTFAGAGFWVWRNN